MQLAEMSLLNHKNELVEEDTLWVQQKIASLNLRLFLAGPLSLPHSALS